MALAKFLLVLLKEIFRGPIPPSKPVLNDDCESNQGQAMMPDNQTGPPPSGQLSQPQSWQFERFFDSTPFSLLYYVKVSRPALLEAILLLPPSCAVLIVFVLGVIIVAEVGFFAGHFIFTNDSVNGTQGNLSTGIEVNSTLTEYLCSGIMPRLGHIWATGHPTFICLFFFVYLSLPIVSAIDVMGKKHNFHELRKLIRNPQPEGQHWMFRVTSFLAMSIVAYANSDWLWLGQPASANASSSRLPFIIVVLRTMIFFLSSGPALLVVLLPKVIFPSFQDLAEFEQASGEWLKSRGILPVDSTDVVDGKPDATDDEAEDTERLAITSRHKVDVV